MSNQLPADQSIADEATDDDMAPISTLLQAARPHGLEVEAVWSFANQLKRGDTFWDAANHAMREWDL